MQASLLKPLAWSDRRKPSAHHLCGATFGVLCGLCRLCILVSLLAYWPDSFFRLAKRRIRLCP
ncbi:hypothetical protein EGJ27_09075 [Pseudomonas sp. v388]|nr:hypothetical protein EGJ27_09075 [Pseudomonas sp. v388]